MKKFFSSEREVKSYSPLDSQISSADFSLVINFPHKIFVPSKPATLQLSKMVWHLKIGQKLRVLGAKTWGVMFFQNFWLKLKGAILGPQNHFWWFQRQNGGFPNGYFGFLKKKLKSESAILRLPNFCSNKVAVGLWIPLLNLVFIFSVIASMKSIFSKLWIRLLD